jgi:tetratricopeptide (TPR) repeat protein/membrane protease YdiL (CAAX protease family)
MPPTDDPLPSLGPRPSEADLPPVTDVSSPHQQAGEGASHSSLALPTAKPADVPPAAKPVEHQPLAAQPNPQIGLGRALFFWIELCIISVFLGVIFLVLVLIAGLEMPTVLQTANALGIFFGALFVICKRCQPLDRRTLGLRGPRLVHVALALLLVLPLGLLAGEVGNWAAWGLGWNAESLPPSASIQPFLGSEPTSLLDQIEKFYAGALRLPWGLALIVTCLLPAVSEELFFRGFLGRGLVARYGPALGILLTSLLFGVIHINPVRIAVAGVLGIALHAVYLATRSLWIPILVHLVNNVLWDGCERVKLAYKFDLSGLYDAKSLPLSLTLSAAATVATLAWAFYRTRTRWVLADGAVWNPGYVSGEAPPASREARADSGRLTVAPVLAMAMAYGTLAGAVFAQQGTPTKRAVLFMAQGNAYFDAGEMDSAIAAYDQAIALDDSNALVHCCRGLAYLHKKDWKQALADLDRAIQLDPSLPEAHSSRAQAHHNLGNLDLAVRDYTQALALRPTDTSARENRGRIHRSRGRLTDAIADFTEALESDPNRVEILTERAAAYLDRSDYGRARQDLTTALRWVPDDVAACRQMAWLCAGHPEESQREPKRAIALALRAIQLGGESDAYTVGALACAYAVSGQFAEALHWQQKAVGAAKPEEKPFHQDVLALYQGNMPYRLPMP